MKKIHMASDRSQKVQKLTEVGTRFYNCHKSVSVKATRNFTGEKALDYVTELHVIYYVFPKSSRNIYLREDYVTCNLFLFG